MRQQARPGDSPINRSDRCGHLHDALAARTAQLGSHLANHLEARRHILQHLGHVLANALHRGGALRTGGIGHVDHRLARQVLGQGLAHRFASGRSRRCRCLLGNARLKVLDDQFELLDSCGELLRRATELHAPQPREFQLEPLDPGAQIHEFLLPSLQLRLARLQRVVATLQSRVQIQYEGAQCIDIIRKSTVGDCAHARILATRACRVNHFSQ